MRIRTIKPEFFRSPDTAKASPQARLFFIAMWCWADDWGIGETNLNGLLGFAFPDEDDVTKSDVETLCLEVAEAFGVVFYLRAGRPYYTIPSWDEHQKTQKKANRKNLSYASLDTEPDLRFHADDTELRRIRDFSANEEGEIPYGTGEKEREQGNRGKGKGTTSGGSANDISATFEAWWKIYPRKADKGSARVAFEKVVGRGVDVDALIAGAMRYRDDPNRESTFTKYPATWLNKECWDDDPIPNRGGGRAAGSSVVVARLAQNARNRAAGGADTRDGGPAALSASDVIDGEIVNPKAS